MNYRFASYNGLFVNVKIHNIVLTKLDEQLKYNYILTLVMHEEVKYFVLVAH